ncbi:hypothetical protein TNCV_1451431 [Trichonephila clavipes]|nr:hypothetical protein TNCV_1451431 [Trichonephila clavipes]
MPLQLGTLNGHRAAYSLVRLVEGEERFLKASIHLQGVFPQNCGGTEQNRTVICMMLKATDNDRRTISFLPRRISEALI